MQKSYISRKTISFPGSNYYVRPGDILVHDPSRNQITVYRDGEITKIIEQMTFGTASMVSLKWLEEIKSAAKIVKAEPDKKQPLAKKKAKDKEVAKELEVLPAPEPIKPLVV